jgi:hypothetical protein
MPTHATWRVVVANLRKVTGNVTAKQRKLAAAVSLKLPKILPRLVAAARLRRAYSAELCTEPVHPATYSQLDYLASLNTNRARDARVQADHTEAGAWIGFYLLKRRGDALKRLRLEAGDVVQIENSEGIRLEEVASVTDDGRIYFRGGHGAREWPDQVTVKSRVRDTSKRARAFQKVAANQASARSTSMGFSLAKQLELKDFRITSRPTPSDIEQLRTVIDRAKDEKPIQAFLESHPQILAALLGRSPFVVPRPNFGGKRIPDFLIADVDSRGINWVLIELETPASPVTLRGDLLLDKYARKGTSQVEEWRIWIQNNLDLARRSRREGGLGLVDISPRSKGLVLVGRRSRLHDNSSDVRRPISESQNIEVHTYDYLVERLERALSFSGPSGLNRDLIRPWRDEPQESELQTLLYDAATVDDLPEVRGPFVTGE